MELQEFGFIHVGDWNLDNNLKSGIRYKLNDLERVRAIYAFVVGKEVKYIGVCEVSRTTMKDRMSRYQNRQGSGNNKYIADLIKNQLQGGSTVQIFALSPTEIIDYKGLNIDIVKGLENPLVIKFNPEWNRHS